jgi:outer membrane protein OmpA-like peptidoglycan-associated protein
MKKFIFFAQVYACFFLVAPVDLFAQEAFTEYPNYVVIGAFAVHNNALKFTGDAKKNSLSAKVEKNPNRNLYYVYVLATEDREHAIDEALRLREGSRYFDTWVYSGPLGDNPGVVTAGRSIDIHPTSGRQIRQVSQGTAGGTQLTTGTSNERAPGDAINSNNLSNNQGAIEALGSRIGDPQLEEQKTDNLTSLSSNGTVNRTTAAGEDVVDIGPAPVKASTAPLTAEEVVGKDFYFYVYRADTYEMLDGSVEAVDVEKSRKMGSYPTNSQVKVALPANGPQQVSFVCDVFGFRKQQVDWDPASPSELVYLDEKGNVVVPFELMWLQRGDVAIMYNVFFFKDAAVMRPESRFEVNNLLTLLRENPTYRIRIHGHTNGNASGKIIRMGVPGNFYTLAGTKQGYGSAKSLSEERAMVIRDYLITNGILADRMEVKAWGGKKPIFDKHSVRASENVRVEIEILPD